MGDPQPHAQIPLYLVVQYRNLCWTSPAGNVQKDPCNVVQSCRSGWIYVRLQTGRNSARSMLAVVPRQFLLKYPDGRLNCFTVRTNVTHAWLSTDCNTSAIRMRLPARR